MQECTIIIIVYRFSYRKRVKKRKKKKSEFNLKKLTIFVVLLLVFNTTMSVLYSRLFVLIRIRQCKINDVLRKTGSMQRCSFLYTRISWRSRVPHELPTVLLLYPCLRHDANNVNGFVLFPLVLPLWKKISWEFPPIFFKEMFCHIDDLASISNEFPFLTHLSWYVSRLCTNGCVNFHSKSETILNSFNVKLQMLNYVII